MEHTLQSYLHTTGLAVQGTRIRGAFEEKLRRAIASAKPDPKLFAYPVPKLTADGLCSISEEYEEQLYGLAGILAENGIGRTGALRLVSRLDKAISFLHESLGADWTGIYKKLRTKDGPALVKLAYRGKPSRAEFPLTREFAEHSNNSTVGLTGKAVLVQNVRSYVAEGKPYYTCDAKVASELCLPVLSPAGELSGIIDIESFSENFFTDDRIRRAAALCLRAGEIL